MKKKEYIIFARDIQVSVFPQYMIVYVWNKVFKDNFGLSTRLGVANRKKLQDYFIPADLWKKFQLSIHRRAEKDNNFIREVEQKARQSVKKLNDFTEKEIFKKDLTKLTNNQLANIYQRFFKLGVPCYFYGNLVFTLEFGERAYFSGRLRKLLQARAKAKAGEYYDLLVSLSDRNIFYDQTFDIIKLSHKINQNKKLKNLILKMPSTNIARELGKKYPAIYKEFKKQKDKYHWLFYNWEGPEMMAHDFILFAKDILRRGQVATGYKKKKDELKILKQKQNQIMRKLNFTKQDKWYVEMAQFCSVFQPLRKSYQFKSCWHMTKYFTEVAKRLDISLDQTRYLTHWEMAKALKKKKVDIDNLNKRRQFFMIRFIDNKITVTVGDKAEKFLKNNIKQERIKKTNKMIGTPACPGKAKGKVRIVNSLEESADFKEGEILVSYATNPVVLPAMRISAAIVTEEGGLTCHAAIVSRELNVPCVVGIKGLVANFKNGDQVEVDAAKGIIKKL